jgi:Zn-dependent protease
MISLLFTSPLLFFIAAGVLLVSLTIHEFAHAWMAEQLGDPTPRSQGRVTLNPLAHLDPVGTVLLLLTYFGWGKPVQFNPRNFEKPRQDAAKVAIAGPISNLLIVLISSALLYLRVLPNEFLNFIVYQFLFTNLALAIFNLFPIYPLDGNHILFALLPPHLAIEYEDFVHRYGMYMLLIALLPIFDGVSLISIVMGPLLNILLAVLAPA